jgi:hypothetical protein
VVLRESPAGSAGETEYEMTGPPPLVDGVFDVITVLREYVAGFDE